MDKLAVFITSLGEKEKKSFRNFLLSKGRGKSNQRLTLFDRISEGCEGDQIRAELYGSQGKTQNGYYQLRKVLLSELEDFLRYFREEADFRTSIYRKLELAQLSMERLQNTLSWQYLREAEEMAAENGYPEILYIINAHQLQLCRSEPMYTVYYAETAEKMNHNLKLLKSSTDQASVPRDIHHFFHTI